MIAGPPPGAAFQLFARWKEFIGHWMLERLGPPKINPRQPPQAETPEAAGPTAIRETTGGATAWTDASTRRVAPNGESAPIELPTQRRSGEPLRWRPRV